MRSIFVILAIVAAINADPDQPCSKQMELEKRCMLTIETSPEATMIRDRKKQIMKTCVPDMPTDCHAELEAAHDCVISIAKNVDSDELFTESKSKSQPAVDQCFEKYPPNVKEGFGEIFMMAHPPPPPHHRHHKHNHTESGESADSSSSSESKSNETGSFERRHHGGGGRGGGGRHHGGGGRGGHGRHCHGGGGRGGHGGRGHGGHGGRGGHGGHGHHHGPRNFSSSESKDNSSSSSSESGGRSGGRSGGHSGGHSGGRSGGKSWEKRIPEQCRKTPEQFKCIRDEFKKLGEDKSTITLMNTLIRQKKKCKQIVDWSCSAKCPKRRHCIWKATEPCRQAFMTRMKTCMQNKGFTLPPFMRGADAFTTPTPVIDQ